MKGKNTFNEGFLPPYYMMYTIRSVSKGSVSIGTYLFSDLNDGSRPDVHYSVRYKKGNVESIDFT